MVYKLDDIEFEFITIEENSDQATIFKHFKGGLYKILSLGKDSSNLNDVVIYKSMIDNKYWVREASEFFSLVDNEKYPLVKQKYRFEKVK